MIHSFRNLPSVYQGIICLLAGVTVLLYAFGFLQKGITFVVVIFACYLIMLGAVKTGIYQKLIGLLHRHHKH